MSRLYKIFAIVSFAAVCCLSAMSGASAVDKYVFGVPMLNGVSNGSLANMVSGLAKVLSAKTGTQITVNAMPYNKGDDEKVFLAVMEAMKSGRADFTLINDMFQYIKFKDKAGSLMVPTFALALNNSTQASVCAYVRKDSPYTTIASLKGKTWGGSHTMQMRFLMSQSGINVPIRNFVTVKFIDDTKATAPFDALLANSMDVYTTVSYLSQMALSSNKKYSTGVREFGCTPYEYTWTFMYRKGTPQALVDKLKTIMLNSAKDKDFAQFKFMLAAIKGKFVNFNAAELTTTEKVVGLMKKYGWEKEEHDFLKAKK